ncbi:MAG: hypothetical protein MH321_11060 [Leptospiraceae bacterium]|nr:hypothetical protein [Leptospiraceae bacterium]
MKKYLTAILIILIFSFCNESQSLDYISHPVTLSLNEYLANKDEKTLLKENIEKSNLLFKGINISTKTIKEPKEKILYKNSDISYYVLQGSLIIGESNKTKILVNQNEMLIIPRNIEHSLIPFNDKMVKLLIHQSID